jgi:hypothetical protein
VRKLTFDAAAPAASKAAAAPKAEAPKARGGIKFELGESAMVVSAELLRGCVHQRQSFPILPAWNAASVSCFGLSQRSGIQPHKLTCMLLSLFARVLQLLRQVSSAEVKQEAVVKHQELEQQRALDMLPGSFEVVRSIYGERGPCVKPKAEVRGGGTTACAAQLPVQACAFPAFA